MRQLIAIALLSIFISCSKADKQKDPRLMICVDSNSWLTQKQSALSGCTCLTAIYKGEYLSQVVYEIRVIDPLCNGINIVYKTDGTMLLNSGDQPAYQFYLSAVKNLQMVWSCAR